MENSSDTFDDIVDFNLAYCLKLPQSLSIYLTQSDTTGSIATL